MMTTPLEIRAATLADAETIAEFNRLLALESENKQLNPSVLERGVRRALARPELCRYFVAEAERRVVGQTMLTYEWSDWRAGVFWWIQSVYVVPDRRGRGVFRALFRHIETLAKNTSEVCGLRLYVEEHNAPAIAAYGRMGMSPSGHLLYELDWSGDERF
ncbi:MAG TPA: GNAT family N-acetyltransferase [Pirellulales bacterium]|nr:GNAT family N-acetyltransferase [Pirellulales bacterium]